MRLFYALVPPEREKLQILAQQDKLRSIAQSGRFTPSENLHMTLQFLGEIPQERLKALKEILTMAARTAEPFSLTLDAYGWFSGKGQERLWYLTGNSPEATQLSCVLGQLLVENGFSVEDRALVPHITLSRRCRLRNDAVLEPLTPITIPVQRLWLMESRQIRGSVVYVPVHHGALG